MTSRCIVNSGCEVQQKFQSLKVQKRFSGYCIAIEDHLGEGQRPMGMRSEKKGSGSESKT